MTKAKFVDGRQFLVESTPLHWIAPKLAALPRFAGEPLKREPQSLKQLLAAASRNAEREARSSTPGAGVLPGQMVAVSTVKHDDEPGVVL
ncbi:MAG TPA: hypothetical protein VFZ59_13595, partial [Verrucomicrobiae bacterium]|nr:hypothetical protein [Verrucomicrobiae bacterium]